MKISILTENTAGTGFLAEHGLSYLIDYDGEKILFDTGHTSVFLHNAGLLGLDLINLVKTIVLSHGHWDHGDGLRFIDNKFLLTHPGAFKKRYHKGDSKNIGLALSKEELEKKFTIKETSKPYHLSQNIIYLGSIPRNNDFESKTTNFVDENGKEDFVEDDSAMVLIENGEIVIITGCAHSGVCNITDYAIETTGIKKIKAVIGGFHLKQKDIKTQSCIEYLKGKEIKRVFPSHCTELPALCQFQKEFAFRQIKTGMTLSL